MTFYHTFHDVKFWKSEFKFRKRIRDLTKILKNKNFQKNFRKKKFDFFRTCKNRDFRADF